MKQKAAKPSLASPPSTARTVQDLVLRPAEAFRAIKTDPLPAAAIRYGMLFLATLILGGLISFINYGYIQREYGSTYLLPPFFTVYAGIFIQFILLFTAGLLLLAFICHLLVALFGGQEGIGKTLAVVLYAAGPILLTFWIYVALAGFSPSYSAILYLGVILWAATLSVIGIREMHEISTVNAAVPVIVIAAIPFTVFLVMGGQIFPAV